MARHLRTLIAAILCLLWATAGANPAVPADSLLDTLRSFYSRASAMPDGSTAPQDIQKQRLDVFVDSLSSTGALDQAVELSYDLLNDPESDLCNRPLLRHLLERAVQLPEESTAARARFRLEVLDRNAPGTLMADFALTDRNGTSTSLHSELKALGEEGAARIAVIFHDPDCDRCRETLATIGTMTLPDGTAVLAVDVSGDPDLFAGSAPSLPNAWRVAFSTADLEEEGVLDIPSLPVIYLLSPAANVILKETSTRLLQEY